MRTLVLWAAVARGVAAVAKEQAHTCVLTHIREVPALVRPGVCIVRRWAKQQRRLMHISATYTLMEPATAHQPVPGVDQQVPCAH